MKQILGILLLMALPVFGYSYSQVIEHPITVVSNIAYNGNALVQVSSSTWTEVTPATSLKHRDGIFFNNPSSNSGSFFLIFSTAATAPTASINTSIIEAPATGESLILYIDDNIHVFAVSRATGTQCSFVQQFKQR